MIHLYFRALLRVLLVLERNVVALSMAPRKEKYLRNIYRMARMPIPPGVSALVKDVRMVLGMLKPAFRPGVSLSFNSVLAARGLGGEISIRNEADEEMAVCRFDIYLESGVLSRGQITWVEVEKDVRGRNLADFLLVVVDTVTSRTPYLTQMTLSNYTDHPDRAASGLYSRFSRAPGEAGQEGEMVQRHHAGTGTEALRAMWTLGQLLADRAQLPPPWADGAGVVLMKAAGQLGQTTQGGGKARRRRRGTARRRGRSRRGGR